MTHRILIALALAVPLRCAAEPPAGDGRPAPRPETEGGAATEAPVTLEVTSPSFRHMEPIPETHTCDGRDALVPLDVANVPAEAKSLAIVMDDPDVPKTLRPDGNWDHWLVWNLPPSATSIREGSLPGGAMQGKNSWGRNDWGGPCPPDREHRYFFKVFALDSMLDIPASSGKPELLRAMEGHVIGYGELVGRYDRKRKGT